MARETGRAAWVLSAEQRAALAALAASRTAPLREVERAGILLQYAEGQSISAIHRQLGEGGQAGSPDLLALPLKDRLSFGHVHHATS